MHEVVFIPKMPVMYIVLSLLTHLLDAVFPPPGGTRSQVDEEFDDLVARFHRE